MVHRLDGVRSRYSTQLLEKKRTDYCLYLKWSAEGTVIIVIIFPSLYTKNHP